MAKSQAMKCALAVLGVLLVAAGCGDNSPAVTPDAAPTDLLGKLRALPGVTAEVRPTDKAGYTYYVLHFTQPVDHDATGGPTFQQEVSLLHRDEAAPMIVQTSGYWDYYLDSPVELTNLLAANQISIEHRYFAESRPVPTDWSKLTIAQMAADEHAIIAALHTIYSGKFLTTGGSKGGMTAVYHRRFYPDDVAGTVPYVAPLSFGAPDLRYAGFLDTLGTTGCRQQVRDVATEMLANRRAALLARAQDQAATDGRAYTRIAIGPAVESAIVSLEWTFWQYYGANVCGQVPATTATDDTMWSFLDNISPVSDNADDSVAQFDAYYYQAYVQLGYPDGGAAYLDSYLMYSDADYDGALPTAIPAYDGGTAMHDIDTWVQNEGDRLLFIYGEWDPWSGGEFELGQAADSLRLVQAHGTHGSRISRLADADRLAVYAKLEAWTGVPPIPPAQPRSRPELGVERHEPRVPPAIVRALRARGRRG
jgi:hypothetical protein